MKITVNKALEMFNALGLLDGYEKAVGDKVIREFYTFGAARLTIAKNANRLKAVVEAFTEARNALFKEFSGGKDEIKDKKKLAAFEKQVREMLETEHEVELEKFKVDLNVNPVPLAAIMALEPLLDVS